MHFAMTLPQDHLDLGLSCDPLAEVFIRKKDHAIYSQRLHHLHGVSRCAADIRLSLHLCRSVHIGHHGDAGIGLTQKAYVVAGDRLYLRDDDRNLCYDVRDN